MLMRKTIRVIADQIRFDPGQIVMTPGAADALAEAGQKPSELLIRHIMLDQGELDANDQRENERAMKTGLRILSAYKTAADETVWLITEAVDIEAGDDPSRRSLDDDFDAVGILRPKPQGRGRAFSDAPEEARQH